MRGMDDARRRLAAQGHRDRAEQRRRASFARPARWCASTNYADALAELRQASELAPDNARYAYVYAIALNTVGSHPQAMNLLEDTHRRHPADRDVLLALVSIARDSGDFATACGTPASSPRLSRETPSSGCSCAISNTVAIGGRD